MTSHEKLNAALGIPVEQSIDDFLDGLSIDSPAEISNALSTINDGVKTCVQKIDENLVKAQSDTSCAIEVLADINTSMSDIRELVDISKRMFKHCYEAIISTDLIDPELIGSTAKLMESIHISIAEFISLYRSRQTYFDRIKILALQQEQRKELLELKHKYDLELLQARNGNSQDISAENLVSYSQEDIIRLLNENKSVEDDNH